MRRRVVVTGVGTVSPLGLSAPDHFARWIAGESAARLVHHPLFERYTSQLRASVEGYDRRAVISNRMLRKLLSPSAGFAVGAAAEALRMGGLTGESELLERCGLYVGSLSLEIDPEVFIPPLRASLDKDGNFDLSLFARRGMKILDPLFLVRALPNAGICGISVEHQVLGPNTNLTNGPTSGLAAVALAAAAIERGEIECALAAGYDTLLGVDSFVEHLIAGRLSRRYEDPAGACRPFDRERDGFVVGEGAACVLLESETHARRRGGEIIGELLGFGQTTSAAPVEPGQSRDSDALHQAARRALRAGRCPPDRLGVVHVDGRATDDDVREAAAVRAVAGGARIPVTSATPGIGFVGAASGVFSLIHALLALREGVIPPLLHRHTADPECPVDFVAEATPSRYDRALVWNGDGGVKSVAVLVGAHA